MWIVFRNLSKDHPWDFSALGQDRVGAFIFADSFQLSWAPCAGKKLKL